MSTATADPDTGGRRAIAEDEAARLAWWIEGPFGTMPASVAALPREEQAAEWSRIDGLASRHGKDFIANLAAHLKRRNATRSTTDVNEPTDPADT